MTQKYLNIKRMENDKNSTYGWFVTLQRRGKIYSKGFYDGTHGGKRSALQKAKAYRDELIARYPPFTKQEYVSIKRKNNKTGMPGVCCSARVTTLKSGKETYRWYYIASWATSPGKSKQVKFSIDEYGEEIAFAKACAARRQAVKQIKGDFLPRKSDVNL